MAVVVGATSQLERIKNSKLVNIYEKSTSIISSSLWQNQPTFAMVVRRPGCKLCRSQAQDLNKLRPEFERRNIKLVAISHQDNSGEEFAEKYFGSKDFYLDQAKDFYKVIWDGKVKTKGPAALLMVKFWKNWRNAGKEVQGNFKGDGYHLGGLILVGKAEAGVQWVFKEENLGDKPTSDEIIKAINDLVPMNPVRIQAAAPSAVANATQGSSNSANENATQK